MSDQHQRRQYEAIEMRTAAHVHNPTWLCNDNHNHAADTPSTLAGPQTWLCFSFTHVQPNALLLQSGTREPLTTHTK